MTWRIFLFSWMKKNIILKILFLPYLFSFSESLKPSFFAAHTHLKFFKQWKRQGNTIGLSPVIYCLQWNLSQLPHLYKDHIFLFCSCNVWLEQSVLLFSLLGWVSMYGFHWIMMFIVPLERCIMYVGITNTIGILRVQVFLEYKEGKNMYVRNILWNSNELWTWIDIKIWYDYSPGLSV